MATYTQKIIDVVYARGCIKLEVLVDIIASELGEDRNRVEVGVKKALQRMVRAGIVVRRGKGYYCTPTQSTCS